jgi:hypothetical protein
MPSKKLIEAKPCGIELSLGLFELALRNQHIGKTPIDFRIAARKRWQEQRFRVAGAALTRADLCQVYTCLHIAGQVRNRVDTRARQDSDPVQARVRPTACRAESRPMPAETAKRLRKRKAPVDTQRPPRRNARDRQAGHREGPDTLVGRWPRAPRRKPSDQQRNFQRFVRLCNSLVALPECDEQIAGVDRSVTRNALCRLHQSKRRKQLWQR